MSLVACPECGLAGEGKFCAACGAKRQPARLTLHSLLHEVFHYFTHLDKGFGFTLKELARRPGTMQREYVEGRRGRHQKPFSMFFLCGTICGIAYYFINKGYDRLYGADNNAEADFFRHYFVLLQAALVPFYAALTWIIFRDRRRNFAEVLVLLLYMLSFTFLVLIIFQALKLVFPNYENRYLEVAFLFIYNPLTNLRFFGGNRWISIAKSLLAITGCYLLSQWIQSLLH